MIICSKCGRENEDSYKYCLGCGASLAEQRQAAAPAAGINCPQCSAQITPGQRFCGGCGYKVGETASVQPIQPAELAQPPAPEPAPTQINAPAPEPAPVPAAAPAPVPAPAPAAAPAPEPVAAAPVAAAPAAQPIAHPSHEPTSPASMPAQSPPVSGAPGAPGRLIMIRPDGSSGEVFDLVTGENIIGRATPAPVFQRDEFLSPQHARFVIQGDQLMVEDLGSMNGVYYRIVEEVELTPGDHIRVGQEVLHFQTPDMFPVVHGSPDPSVQPDGGPLHGAWGRLARVSAPENAATTAFLLTAPEHSFGRERGDFTFPDDGYVSGLHARISTREGRFFLEDLRSSNGTFVRIRGTRTVPNGTLILMGRQPFRIQLG